MKLPQALVGLRKLIILVCLCVNSDVLLATFIDVDEFRFSKAGLVSGLRVCIFDVPNQKYTAIKYYTFPPTKSRQPIDSTFEILQGIKVKSNGDIDVQTSLSDMMLRTIGSFSRKPKGITFFTDNEAREVAYNSVVVKKPNDIKKTLCLFKKGAYGKSDFKAQFYKFPSLQADPKTFRELTGDTKENNDERKIIGELATRMTFYFYGYFNKVPSQTKDGQGIDGIYFSSMETDNSQALFLTESKCRDESVTPKKVMQEQLDEKSICDNLGRLAPEYKDKVRGFIAKFPNKVFKAAHRILIDGSTEWLVEALDIDAFQSLSIGIISPEKDKETLIATIADNFKSPEELLRVMFSYYKISDDQTKLDIFSKAVGYSQEQLEQAVDIYKRVPKQKTAARRLSFPELNAQAAEPTVLPKQEKDRLKNEVKILYSRENLSKLLGYIKSQFKRNACEEINKELAKVDFSPLRPPELSMFSNYEKYKDKLKKYNYMALWEALLEVFPGHFEQAKAKQVFEESS